MPIIKNLSSAMSDIAQLQGTCNNLEKILNRKVTKLEAVLNSAGVKVTEATFPPFSGDIDEIGKAKITAGGSHSAFIKDTKTAVSISRS